MAQPPFVIETNPPSDEILKIAHDELRETPENIAKGLEELRQLLVEDKTMKYELDDEFLMFFLRPCKFYAKSAYDLNKKKEAISNHNVVNVLTNRDHKGRRVLLVNLGASWNPSKVSADQLLRILYLVHLAAMLEPETQIRGAVVIMDYKGLGMKQIGALTPAFAVKLMSFIQDAMPLRLKEVHFVNNPMLFSIVWKIIKPLVREKLNKRIHFHGSKMESLHAFIPPSHLPEDYQGNNPPINYTGKDWYPAIEGHVDHIKKWNACGKV
ncbi:alpha-tocopherol transfer protein-related [Holotrichia oblita]|uniref:Alpha-tocopherol transfer protein-related n=1 Tax=Holotrichia oblita TaxID=644536 RepID=A0ACB9TGR0_HOLOL|nr:alpha-tocopherol transfer protein-related [Holotrichia oblita]